MIPALKSPKEIWWRTILVTFLAIAFGYNEAAVVVYLRDIFHSGRFDFPLKEFPIGSSRLILVEVAREAATLIVILSASLLAGKNRHQRVAYFMIIFAVWDIFYYVFLKVILGWPASIMDWDVLFLIPIAWAGPVLAPVAVSLAMIVFAGIIIYYDFKDRPVKVTGWDAAGFGIAGLIIIVSFCIAGKYMTHPEYYEHFSWALFGVGMIGAFPIFAKICFNKKPRGQAPGLIDSEKKLF
jgi:hypothetical protein